MNQEKHPDKKFHIQLHALELREETKESFHGQENAIDDDDVSDSYFEFPQAGTGDVNSEVVDKMSFVRLNVASPRKPNILEPKAASRFSRGRKSNPFGADKKAYNSIVSRVQTDTFEFNPFNTKRKPHPSFRHALGGTNNPTPRYHERKYSETMPNEIILGVNDNLPFNDQFSQSFDTHNKSELQIKK